MALDNNNDYKLYVKNGHRDNLSEPEFPVHLRLRRRSGIVGAGLSLYARLISHFNITNIVI